MADVITNPILPGFHPDPSIVQVGADYYLAFALVLSAGLSGLSELSAEAEELEAAGSLFMAEAASDPELPQPARRMAVIPDASKADITRFIKFSRSFLVCSFCGIPFVALLYSHCTFFAM